MTTASYLFSSLKGNIYAIYEDGEGDQDRYYVLLVPSRKVPLFLNTVGKKSFRLGDYGKLLSWGAGAPSRETLMDYLSTKTQH